MGDKAARTVDGGASRAIGVVVLLTFALVTALEWKPDHALELTLLYLLGSLALGFVRGLHRAWAVVFVLGLIVFFTSLILDENLLLGVTGLVGCGAILYIAFSPPDAARAETGDGSDVPAPREEGRADEDDTPREGVAALLAVLRAGEPEPCRRARERLVEHGPAAVPALEDALEEDDPDLRVDVREVLKQIRGAGGEV